MRNVLSLFSILALSMLLIIGCRTEKTYKIGISQCSDDDWRNKMNEEVKRQLMFHPNVSYEIRSADDNSQKQIDDIRYFIDNDFDMIIAAPNEAKTVTPIINEAYEKGIPVVLFDRNISNDGYTAWQGADNENIGKAAASYIKKLIKPGEGVIEIQGLVSSTPAQGRHNGFRSEGLNVVAEGEGKWNYNNALKVVDSLIQRYPETKAIFAHNDRMALAAYDATRARGFTPYIIGVDGAPDIGVKAVAEGKIDATFLYPTEGDSLISTAMAILEGTPYVKRSYFPASSAIDKSNVDLMLLQNSMLDSEVNRMHKLKEEVNEYWSQHSSQTSLLYAVIVIVVLLCVLIFMMLRGFWQHRRHRLALIEQNKLLEEERDKQKMLMEQLDEATSSKLLFFTNVSHDLRTPLTLISEPVEQLSKADNLTDRQQSLVAIARKNVSILMRLINQILDFRKYENGMLALKLTEVSPALLIGEWAEAFKTLALRRDIKFAVNIVQKNDATAAIDVEKLESVFYNLVSNAFKYTPENGSITIDSVLDVDSLTIRVTDSGKGISAEDLPLIFDRFYQVDRMQPKGSGIGLALAKAFVELHGGTIAVESAIGKGTTFTVVIPVKHTENKHVGEVSQLISSETVEIELSNPEADLPQPKDDRLPSVLVIDDNADIRVMLKELLADDYHVIAAANGVDGLRLASKYTPDVIVCDVMMPEMDGLECCRRLKAEVTTSHIPVLMLTACAMDEQRASGYDVGADGYIAKPFNAGVLQSRIRNLVENRKRIFDLYSERNPAAAVATASETEKEKPATKNPAPSLPGSPDIDNEFYQKFLSIVKAQMSDPDLNVDSLASALGLGRSQFYRKIKALTNYSPVELLRRIRLTRARKLLTGTEMTVSEISYSVGFSTPAYFTKCYREAFGETPSESREKLLGQR